MKKRGVALLMAAVFAVANLSGCGRNAGGDGTLGEKEKVRLMVWSPSEDQSKESGEWLQSTCEKFAEEHPEWDITFVYGVADEATAASQVAQDPEESADVFMYANDTLTTMTDAKALAKFGGKYREEIENPNFKIDADGSGLAGLRDGSISAIFSGSWDANAVKEALGENMGAAALPTFTVNGEEKQMMAYAGSKAIGVNPYSKNMVAAVELAVYLGSAEAQMSHYKLRNVIPCNTELLADETIASDPLVSAQNNTFNHTSILQPFVAKMNNCWVPVENMGKGIRNGSVTHENVAEQTEAMNEAMNSDGI